MTITPPALLIARLAVEKDVDLQPSGKGKRKIAVTRLFDDEIPTGDPIWEPTRPTEPKKVIKTSDLEISYFNQQAVQDRHRHSSATEIYTVIEGRMPIRIGDEIYLLTAGDTAVVRPETVHEVLKSSEPFLCQVVATHISVGDKKQ